MKDWKKVKLGSLLTESKIVSENPNTDKRLRVRLNMNGVEKRPNTSDKEGATKYYVRKAGQFIYGKQNLHKGAFGIIPQELDDFESSSDIPAFDVDESCYPQWIYYFFKKGDFYAKLEGLAKGVGSKRINPSQIFKLDIYLPIKEEQRKILDEIEKIEKHNQDLSKEIHFQEKNLEKLRQSILTDAIRGRLTEEWRNSNMIIQSGGQLLKTFKNSKSLNSISDKEIPFKIPESWSWCTVGTFSNIQNGYAFKSSKFSTEGVRLLRNINIAHGVIDWRDSVYYPESELKNLDKYKLEKGDIVISLDRPLISTGLKISKILDEDLPSMLLQRVGRFKISDIPIDKDFLYYWLNSNEFISRLVPSKTIGVPHISTKKIESFPFPVPPLIEQKEIVENVKALIFHCDNLEKEITNKKQHSEKLMQSVLTELLGTEKNSFKIEEVNQELIDIYSRKKVYDNKTTLMELIDLLKEHGKLHAEDLWKMSKHFDNKNIGDSIDQFYSELKKKIEIDKTIKEVENEKGYLELV